MSYPLILQAIQKIDDMYHSTRLASFFQKQWPFKLFNAFLLIAIPVSIIAPFALYYNHDNGCLCLIIELIHSIVILGLLVSAVILFKFIMITTRPSDFQRYIIRRCDDPDNPTLIELFQIAKYASDTEDERLFSSTIAALYVQLRGYRKNCLETGKYEYPAFVWEFLRELLRQHSKKDNNFFTKNNVLCTLFFTPVEYFPFMEDEFIYLWQSVDAVLHTDNDKWIYSFWTFADQYYRFVLQNPDKKDKYIKGQRARFSQLHFMLGALLIYNKKFELLNKLMFFSNSEPPEYALVPSSFSNIWEIFMQILETRFAPLVITQRYIMQGAPQDVSSDSFIYEQAYNYAALLMIRLFGVNDWNITYSNPLSIPRLDADLKIEELNELINIQVRLKVKIEWWYDNPDNLNVLLNNSVPTKDSVLNLCDLYIGKCLEQIQTIRNSKLVDHGKIEYIKNHLIEAMKFHKLSLPQKEDLVGIDTSSFLNIEINNAVQTQIDDEIIKKGTYVNASNLPDILIEKLNDNVYKAYNYIFLRHTCDKSFAVSYRDIKKALVACNVNETFAVLSMGIYLGNYDAIHGHGDEEHFEEVSNKLSFRRCEIYKIPSAMQCLIILKKSDLPFIELIYKDVAGISLIDEDSHLYSNIDSIKELGEEKQSLLVSRGIVIKEPNRKIRYIRLSINYNYDATTDYKEISDQAKLVWG